MVWSAGNTARVATLVALLLSPTPAVAQPASAQPLKVATDPAWSIGAGYEAHRFRYQFENPSSIDSPFLVPHSYEQAYVADTQWLVVSARYTALGGRLESEFGVTPSITASAADIDTFFDPNDDVVTSGTDGDVRMRSWRLAQWSEGRLWGMPLRLGYRYRRDRSDFLPADVVVAHSRPHSVTRRFTTDREQTVSQVHEIPVDVAKPLPLSRGWGLVLGASVSPLVFARLTTLLPDKYPEQPIVADARAFAVDARVQLVRTGTRWPLVLGLGWGKSWSVHASRQFNRDALQLVLGIGYRP